MGLLFVNACMRAQSRTERLARAWLEMFDSEVEEIRIGQLNIRPLEPQSLVSYGRAVSTARYEEGMFDYAKQFAAADEVLIAAPFWNFSIPAKLHDYLELVCTQGVTFDVDETGAYVSLCRARKLTFVTTSGGIIAPEDDHAFGYVQTLAKVFWHIPEVSCVMAEGLDAAGANVEALLAAALKHEGNVKSCMQD